MHCLETDVLASIALALPADPAPAMGHLAACEACQAVMRDCRELRSMLHDAPLTDHELRVMVLAALDAEDDAIGEHEPAATPGQRERKDAGWLRQDMTIFISVVITAVLIVLLGSVGTPAETSWPGFLLMPLLAGALVTAGVRRRASVPLDAR